MNEEIISYVKAACGGDTDAMAKLYSGTLKVSYFLALKLSGDKAQAVEIAKKAYARAFCTITKLKKPEAFEIWMKQNVAQVYKETMNFIFADAESGAKETNMEFLSEDILENDAKASAVLVATDELIPELRTVVILHYFSGMPVSSLSKLLGVSESTVNSLLERAKDEIRSACGSGDAATIAVGSLPVITKLLQWQMSAVRIDPSDVKDIFSYAVDIYSSFKRVEVTKGSTGNASDNAEFFKNRPTPAVSVPRKPVQPANVPAEPETEESVDFNGFADNNVPERKPAQQKAKINAKNIKNIKVGPLDFKKLCIIGAALIVIIIIIIIVAASSGSKSTKTVSVNTADVVSVEKSTWTPGGFEECQEIDYLDNNYCKFKSKTTGKWGLIDYSGNMVASPIYDDFVCNSNGSRDYDGTGLYVTLVVKDGVYYEFTVSNGELIVNEEPYTAISDTQPEVLDKNLDYEERDRYCNGYAAVEKDGKWGYVDENDKLVIDYQYDAVNTLTSEQALSSDYCRPVSDDKLIPVKKGSKMGIINLSGDTQVEFEYDNIMPGKGGVFIACKDSQWGVILVDGAQATINITYSADDDTDGEKLEEGTMYRCLADSGINVRSGPGAGYDQVGELASGDEVEGFEIKESSDTGKSWLKIQMENGEYGWVALSFMSEV